MESAVLLLIITLLAVSIYDFRNLRKSSVKISSCLSSSLITLVVNIIIFIISALIADAIYGYKKENKWVVIGMVLVGLFSYFRFKGREISKGKVIKRKR